MAPPRRPNPYRDLPRQELYDACQRRAGELMGAPVKRTPAERAELALDTAHLLLATAWWVGRTRTTPHSPQRALHGDPGTSFVDAWLEDYQHMFERCASAAHRQVLLEAADLARGRGDTRQWLDPSGSGYALYLKGTGSDEGLREALAELEAIYRRRQRL